LIDAHCPHCGASYRADDDLAGSETACPACGRPFRVPAHGHAGDIIDVTAHAPGDPEPEAVEPEPRGHAHGGGRFDRREFETPFGRVRTFRMDFGRATYDPSGCGTCGCLVLLLFVFFAIRGCIAVFSGG